MTTVATVRPAERMALRLAAADVPVRDAVSQLAAFDHDSLAAARDALVQRLLRHGDDRTAAFALQAVYQAIAART